MIDLARKRGLTVYVHHVDSLPGDSQAGVLLEGYRYDKNRSAACCAPRLPFDFTQGKRRGAGRRHHIRLFLRR
jgi:hypothetical protein